MTDYAKDLATNSNWPAPKRNSVFYSMSQRERINSLSASSWPNLDWGGWVALFEDNGFDRQIAADARSGKFQRAFGLDEMDPIHL